MPQMILPLFQLAREYRDGLRLAVTVRRKFSKWGGALAQHLDPKPLDIRRHHSFSSTNTLANMEMGSRINSRRSSRVREMTESSNNLAIPNNMSRRNSKSRDTPDIPEDASVDLPYAYPYPNYGEPLNHPSHLAIPQSLNPSSYSAPTSPYRRCRGGIAVPPNGIDVPSALTSHMSPLMVPPQLSPLTPREFFQQNNLLEKPGGRANGVISEEDCGNGTTATANQFSYSVDEVPVVLDATPTCSSSSGMVQAKAASELQRDLDKRQSELMESLDNKVEQMLQVATIVEIYASCY